MTQVSIIVPLFNKENRIKSCIHSVLNQSFKDFELIIINDGSTDNSEQFVLDEKEMDSRIRYFTQINKGVSAARNEGIKRSRGKYITFLDADDEISYEFLKKMMKAIDTSNVCYTGHHYIDGKKKKKSKMKFIEGDIFEDYLYNKCTPNTNSWLINRDFIIANNIFFMENICWGEDMFFFSEVLLMDRNVKVAKGFLTNYFINQNGSLSENIISKIDEDILWLEDLKTLIESTEADLHRKKRLVRAISTYRLPASVLYRMIKNRNIVSKHKMDELYSRYNSLLKEIKLSNGIRSVKLYCYWYFIIIKINIKGRLFE